MEKLEKNEAPSGRTKACLLLECLAQINLVRRACNRAEIEYKEVIYNGLAGDKTAETYYKDCFEVLSDFVVTLHRCIADLPREVQEMARERVARGDWLGGAQDGHQ